ncbi:hypothetical protein CHLRE_07g332066v5 [Chlamydomonas reinhardtii]|uniref:Uncharacterized protein n=1 Tax=Chlamydomonas reinhardtii TaxID=3055 RepID=A0A2K3DJY5_CHLRE|nr:uncharacterized protein CHLRE_07g332066v5 [Chlamydomonas reinhardtii]PNW80847.1 hypothetical protein CHLRE_07g332066v5 [Chlamydomonas reinhardtii]
MLGLESRERQAWGARRGGSCGFGVLVETRRLARDRAGAGATECVGTPGLSQRCFLAGRPAQAAALFGPVGPGRAGIGPSVPRRPLQSPAVAVVRYAGRSPTG